MVNAMTPDAMCTQTGRGQWWCSDGSPSAPPNTSTLPSGVVGEFLADGTWLGTANARPPPASTECAFFANGGAQCGAPTPRGADLRTDGCMFTAAGERACARR